MARIFVASDNLSSSVEIVQDPETGHFQAYCAGCSRGAADPVDLTDGTHTASEEDATQLAGIHVDRCRRCADPNCLTTTRHDVGSRCRLRPFI